MLEPVSWAVYGLLAAVSFVFWVRRRNVPSAWLAATFCTLGAVVLQGAVVPEIDPATPVAQFSARGIYTDALIIALLAFPYLLHRFVRSLRPRRNFGSIAADVGMVVVVVLTIAAPHLGLPETLSPAMQILRTFYILWWAVILGSVSWMLWRTGRGRPGIIRIRMRLMSAAAFLLNLALVVSLAGDPEGADPVEVITLLLGWASAATFLIAFEPPAILRRLWREHEEQGLRQAETGLVSATTPEQAAGSIVAAAAALVGGDGAEVRNLSGDLLAQAGELIQSGEASDSTDLITIRGVSATLAVRSSPLTPVFGQGEEALLAQLCGHLDLAMKRIDAAQESERSREATERANAELTQLVYGVSHDLRNPLVTVLGFLDLLKNGKGSLNDNQVHAIERIEVSAKYMEGLINDLLQLSRVGRTDADRRPVVITDMAVGIANDMLSRFPGVSAQIDGQGIAAMNPLRARQLLINLMENAARHGGRTPLVVGVHVRPLDQQTIEVLVADDGIGIPEGDRERVFQIFQRLERFDASAEGSGIGLTMCRRIVEDIGGSLELLSTDSGTTMRILLPRHPSDPAPVVADSALSTQGA